MNDSAILLTDGYLTDVSAKTAHGLLAGPSRYPIVAVVDHKQGGKSTGSIFSHAMTDVPIFLSVSDAMEQLKTSPTHCIVGVAPVGGVLSSTLKQSLLEGLQAGLNLVSGLHALLGDDKDLVKLAKSKGLTLHDIRKPRPTESLHMWDGSVAALNIPRIAILGIDCAVGKRSTAQCLLDLCKTHGIDAGLVYTGQTGWLQGLQYGFILDATPNDFVAGELERVVLECAENENPDLIFIEGQSSLRNPAGPCGSEHICSAGAKYVILQHEPGREYFLSGGKERSVKLPDIVDEVSLIQQYGAAVAAIALKMNGLSPEAYPEVKTAIQQQTHLPVVCPMEEGGEAFLPVIQSILKSGT